MLRCLYKIAESSSRLERSGSGECDFLICWGKGKGKRSRGDWESERVGDGDLEFGKRVVTGHWCCGAVVLSQRSKIGRAHV